MWQARRGVLGVCVLAVCVSTLAMGAWRLSAEESPSPSAASGPQIAHDLYLSLADNSAENQAAILAEAKRCLAPHPGIVYFATGRQAKSLQGMFSDRDFDLVVHMVFVDQAALTTYARSKLHQEFVVKMAGKVKKLRIFDSEIEPYSAPAAG